MTERVVRANGIDMRVVEMGAGPLVVLCHGFPELAHSWRHQLPALARAGYHAVAPDMRGYGGTSRPERVEAYDIVHLTGDVLGLIDAMGEERAVLVGHDWGAQVVWNLALRAPERVRGVAAMSVPYRARSKRPPTTIWKTAFADRWFYMLYFQEPGVADADLGHDPATFLRRLLCAAGGEPSGAQLGPLVGARDGRGMVERLPEPDRLPGWLPQEDLDHYAAVFARTGFTGGLNWYRNIDRNWELTPELADARVEVPALFVAGAGDPVLAMMPAEGMEAWVTDLRGMVVVAGAGHWVQQERPAEVNEALARFLAGLDG
ncbi:MAG TPA: alpha/beta hydrolase [Candidatus Eisenbacteria bacterium]|nr:alpha/beta hydrolase [Candidatus Eisenbacteria bacterium]